MSTGVENRWLRNQSEQPAINLHGGSPAAIEVQIEELVLDGFAGIDSAQIGAIVQQELARLLAAGEVAPALLQSGTIAQIDGGALTVQPGAQAEVLGAQIAHAVYGGLTA
ncbi:MAG: hypothetical protein R3E79_43845 [Caldilineaceae bacterium]